MTQSQYNSPSTRGPKRKRSFAARAKDAHPQIAADHVMAVQQEVAGTATPDVTVPSVYMANDVDHATEAIAFPMYEEAQETRVSSDEMMPAMQKDAREDPQEKPREKPGEVMQGADDTIQDMRGRGDVREDAVSTGHEQDVMPVGRPRRGAGRMDMGRVTPEQIAERQTHHGMRHRRSHVRPVSDIAPSRQHDTARAFGVAADVQATRSAEDETQGHIAGGGPSLAAQIDPASLRTPLQQDYVLTAPDVTTDPGTGTISDDADVPVALFGAQTYAAADAASVPAGRSDSYFAQNLEMRAVDVSPGLSFAAQKKRHRPLVQPRVHMDALFERQGLTQSQMTRTYHVMMVALVGVGLLSSVLFVGKAFAIKDRTMARADAVIGTLKGAGAQVAERDFAGMVSSIGDAHQTMRDAQDDMEQIGGLIVQMSHYIPGASKLASGDALVDAGVAMTAAGQEMARALAWTDRAVLNRPTGEPLPVLALIQTTYDHLIASRTHLSTAEEALARVTLEDLPEEHRSRFAQMRSALLPVGESIDRAIEMRRAIEDLFGANGPRSYLFLFQNNHEMRPSGGFIGSYGFLDISAGHVRTFKIDGIYNPDGQLIDKVVPPRPIQKVSEAWSMHDSNWWPDFPRSAEKAIDFYGRTGGPSVDGVIALTPTVVEKLLTLTGPITLPAYDVTLTADNFIRETQYEVEVGYDKEENRPKKILSDLMPALITALQDSLSEETLFGLLAIVTESLDERHLMLYMRNDDVQHVIQEKRWGGRLLPVEENYLSVVHANINGFKTDGVIREHITHETEIHSNGRVLNTVTIERTHTGGDTGYPWWDAVNADYMRVYVPRGATLISAEGHTREWHPPRLRYDALGYEVDVDVAREEESVTVHEESGTRIYEEDDKTVYGNWVYVSPGETVRVRYVYELPERIALTQDGAARAGSYGTLYQKQAGQKGISLTSRLILPERAAVAAHIPHEHVNAQDEVYVFESSFEQDQYVGVVFEMQ